MDSSSTPSHPSEPPKQSKRIRKRTITHGGYKKCQKNQNCPKFLIASCWLPNEDHIINGCDPIEEERVVQSFSICWKWMDDKNRDKINLDSLKTLFGESEDEEVCKRNYLNSKLLFRFLKDNGLRMVEGRKVTKSLSYLMCLEKYTARLGNPRIADRLQYR